MPHQYREGQYEVEDPIGTGKALTPEFLQQQCIRTLCYPEGAESGGGAELGVIPGSHLYRIPFKWNTERLDEDTDMQANWLKGKIHAITGKPLEIVHLSIPPGKHGFICSPYARITFNAVHRGGTDAVGIVDGLSDSGHRSFSSQMDRRYPQRIG